MPARLPALASSKVIAAAVGGAVIVGSAIAVMTTDTSVEATVVGVVDGDTIDVRYDGDEHRVRLLNIDTPESVDPDQPVQCLGPEATQFLESWLPQGTSVRLEYDVKREDGYGRELAGVFLGERLINADIAREGLGVPIAVGGNVRFLDAVRTAHAEAEQDRRGLYAEDVECTLPAQVAALEAATTTPPLTSSAAPADIAAAGDAIEQSLLAALELIGVLNADTGSFPLLAFRPGGLVSLRGRVLTAHGQLTSARATNETILMQAQARVQAEVRAAEEAARLAAEEAARRAAEEAAAQRAPQQSPPSSPRPPSSGGGSAGSGSSAPRSSGSGSGGGAPTPAPSPAPAPAPAPNGGSDGYTGCRAYGPNGTSVDDQGRRYTKIDCTTRLPIG